MFVRLVEQLEENLKRDSQRARASLAEILGERVVLEPTASSLRRKLDQSPVCLPPSNADWNFIEKLFAHCCSSLTYATFCGYR
jgi:hypothetical protein